MTSPVFSKVMKMQSKLLILALSASSLFLASCNSNKGAKAPTYDEIKADVIVESNINMTTEDTIEVKNLVEDYLNALRASNFDAALSKVKYLNGDSLVDLPSEERARAKKIMVMFKGISYELDYLAFLEETDCAAQYSVTLFEKKDPKDTRPNTAKFMLKPVRQNGKWYLTLADSDNKSVPSSKIPQVVD